MGVRILQGDGRGNSDCACLYDSVTMWSFGPVFEDHDQAQEFLDWLSDGKDPRQMTDAELRGYYHEFLECEEDAA